MTPSQIENIKNEILGAVGGTHEKNTPRSLEKLMIASGVGDRKSVRRAVRELVDENRLTYTYEYGRTFLEPSFNRPVRVTESIVLKPPRVSAPADPNDIVISLHQGISFGSGAHPTTRLSLGAIELLFGKYKCVIGGPGTSVLDIGTGSGILAIAAVRMGMETGTGLDLDPCAISEAAANVELNALSDRIDVGNRPLEELGRRFTLVTANLRYPTLRTLYPVITDLLEERSAVVLSGIRPHEVEGLLSLYTESRFKCLWRTEENGWACVLLEKVRNI